MSLRLPTQVPGTSPGYTRVSPLRGGRVSQPVSGFREMQHSELKSAPSRTPNFLPFQLPQPAPNFESRNRMHLLRHIAKTRAILNFSLIVPPTLGRNTCAPRKACNQMYPLVEG